MIEILAASVIWLFALTIFLFVRKLIKSKPVELAMELLQGNDDFAMKYIAAFRDGDLD